MEVHQPLPERWSYIVVPDHYNSKDALTIFDEDVQPVGLGRLALAFVGTGRLHARQEDKTTRYDKVSMSR